MKKRNYAHDGTESIIDYLSHSTFDIGGGVIKNGLCVGNVLVSPTKDRKFCRLLEPRNDGKSGYRVHTDDSGNLSFSETIELAKMMDQEFGFEERALYDYIAVSVKVCIAKAMKMFNEDEGKILFEVFHEIADKMGIPESFIDKLASTKINNDSHVRSIVSKFKKKYDIAIDIRHTVIGDLNKAFDKAIFRHGMDIMYNNLTLFTADELENLRTKYACAAGYEVVASNDGYTDVYSFESNKEGMVDNKENTESKPDKKVKKLMLRIPPNSKIYNPSEKILVKDCYDAEFWKKSINEAPTQRKKELLTLSAVESIKEIVSSFPWSIENETGQNPFDIAATKEMQCVGKAILCHMLLDKTGIEHKGCMQNEHIDIMVRIGSNDYLLNPNNYSSPIVTMLNTHGATEGQTHISKTIKDNRGLPLVYQLGDAEDMCFFAMSNNLLNKVVDVHERIDRFKILINYTQCNEVMGHFFNLGNGYADIGLSEFAFNFYKKELKLNPRNHMAYNGIGNLQKRSWLYVQAYFSYQNASFYGYPSDDAEFNEKISMCKAKILKMSDNKVSDKGKKYVKWVAKLKKPTHEQLMKALTYDMQSYDVWRKIWLTNLRTPVGKLAYEMMCFSNDNAYRISAGSEEETKDNLFKCLEHVLYMKNNDLIDLILQLQDKQSS